LTAHTTKSRKAKARTLQNAIAIDICTAFPVLGNADVHPAIMGQSGIDICLSSRARDLFPYAIECKNQESLNIWAAISQAEVNAEKERLIPLLVFKRARSEVYAVLRWSELLALLTPREAP
jgi:hypothetical protein